MQPPDPTISELDRPELARLWQAARRRLERNGLKITTSPMQLGDLGDAEIAAICALLSERRPSGNAVRVSLARLDTILRNSPAGVGVVEVLEALDGSIDDRQARRSAERATRDGTWDAAHTHRAALDPEVQEWLASVRRRGRLTRLGIIDPAGSLLTALNCVEWLMAHRPTTSPAPLAVISAQLFGDAHALDGDTAVGTLVWDAVTSISRIEMPREAWRSFGVQLDDVSTSALVYMIPGEPGSLLDAASAGAEPIRVTHRMLDRGLGLAVRPGDIVSVCENPAIVMLAADRLGFACSPLICLEGQPSGATSQLLASVRRAGATLRVHTDFDLGGVAIASHMIQRFEASPWRMGRDDYLLALEGPTTDLAQQIGAIAWDPTLSDVMNAHRRAVHEESVAATLLADLSI